MYFFFGLKHPWDLEKCIQRPGSCLWWIPPLHTMLCSSPWWMQHLPSSVRKNLAHKKIAYVHVTRLSMSFRAFFCTSHAPEVLRLNLSRCFSLLSVFSLKPQTPQNRAKLVSPRCNQSGFLSCAQLNGCPKVYIASFVMFWKAMGMAAEQGSLDSSQPWGIHCHSSFVQQLWDVH